MKKDIKNNKSLLLLLFLGGVFVFILLYLLFNFNFSFFSNQQRKERVYEGAGGEKLYYNPKYVKPEEIDEYLEELKKEEPPSANQ